MVVPSRASHDAYGRSAYQRTAVEPAEDKVVAARRGLLLPVNESEENMTAPSSYMETPKHRSNSRPPREVTTTTAVKPEQQQTKILDVIDLTCRADSTVPNEQEQQKASKNNAGSSWMMKIPDMSAWFTSEAAPATREQPEEDQKRHDAATETREQPMPKESIKEVIVPAAIDVPVVQVAEQPKAATMETKQTPGTGGLGNWITACQPKAATTETKQTPTTGGLGNWITACLAPTPNLPTPIRVLSEEPKKPEDEDDSMVEHNAKIFGDLESLPSARGPTASIATSIRTKDLSNKDKTREGGGLHGGPRNGGERGNNNLEAIIESKVNEIKVPEAMPTTGNGAPADSSLEARRQLLIKELRSSITLYGRYDLRVGNISAALGDLLNECQEHEQACKLHRDAVAIYSTKLGDDNATTMNAKIRLGQVLEDAGHFDEAVNTYYIVMVMRRALSGEKDPSAADALVCMAHALRRKGEYAQAIKELKRSLKIYRESLGDSHEKVSTTVDEIASLYVTIGDFEKSAAILEEVVKLKAATLGLKSKAVAATLISLTTTYECSEEFGKAMKSLKKAYKIYTEIGGYSSEDATATLNRIAQLYEAQGDHNRASIAYLGVLRGRKINLGEDDLLVGETYYKLGHSLRETRQYEKGLKCMKEALPIFVGKGVDMHDVEMIAEVMHEMALINKDKKHFHEAARGFKQELSVRRKIGQPEYPMIARTLNHLGVAEFEMKNNSKALKYLVEALTIFQKQGEQGVDCAEVLFNTGLVFEAVRNKERAYDAFVEAARIFTDRGYNNSHPHLSKCNAKIVKLSQGVGKY